MASCVEKYSLDLTGGAFPLRGQGSKAKLLSCQAVEIFPNCIDREGSVDEGLFLMPVFGCSKLNGFGIQAVNAVPYPQPESLQYLYRLTSWAYFKGKTGCLGSVGLVKINPIFPFNAC